MTIPPQEGRPVWEPVIIALSLALLVVYSGREMQALLLGRSPLGVMARAALELGVAAMMVWGLLTSLYRALRWRPGVDDAA